MSDDAVAYDDEYAEVFYLDEMWAISAYYCSYSKGRRKNKLETLPIPGLWTLLSNKLLIIAHSESNKYWVPARYWVNQILSKN